MRTIGFFGDSFCGTMDTDNCGPEYHNLKTYLRQVTDHYNFKIRNVGYPGSSIYDSLLLQFGPLIESQRIPDVCVFVWTDPHRLFHRISRNINPGGVEQFKHLGNEWKAAAHFYKDLHDYELFNLQYTSTLYYYDNVIFPKLPERVKIIHMWSFGELPTVNDIRDSFSPAKVSYLHRWKTGLEIRPSLMTLTKNLGDTAPNHLATQQKNDIVTKWLINAIDNYENGKLLDFSTEGFFYE